MSPSSSGSTPFAAVVLTHSGRMLVHCAVGDYAQNPTLRPGPLCDLLTTMQDIAGHPPEGYVEMHGMGIVMLEGFRVVIAVLCDPQHGVPTARLVGMQALNVFGKLYHAQAQELDAAHQREASAAAESYTVHSASASAATASAGSDAITLPAFTSFRHAFLLPLLLREPPCQLWLDPLLAMAKVEVLRAFVVNPAPLRSQHSVLLASPPRQGHPLASFAGEHLPEMWAEVIMHCQQALQEQATQRSPANDKQNRRARLSLLAFPELCSGAWCLHVVLRAVRIIPGGACLVVCYAGPIPSPPLDRPPPPPPQAAGHARRMGDLETPPPPPTGANGEPGGVVLDESLVPHDLRQALNQTARLISSAFPTAVTRLPELGAAALLAATAADEESLAAPLATSPSLMASDGAQALAPATPVRMGQPPVRMPAPATPLQLDIESPRAYSATAAGHDPVDDVLAAPPSALHPAVRRELYVAPDDEDVPEEEEEGGAQS